MTISCSQLGKRYTHDQWILRDLSFKWVSPSIVGITGHNGSGKSTLMRLLSGYLSSTEGSVHYVLNSGQEISREDIYSYIQVAAPYDGLVDFMTIEELFDFHYSLRELRPEWDRARWESKLNFSRFSGKRIHDLSSGMQQRLRLLFACTTKSRILLLDEPSSYLDTEGKEWWKMLVKECLQEEDLCVIASNEPDDLAICTELFTVGT